MKKKYAVLVDHNAIGFCKYEPQILEATNMVDAMGEAEQYIDDRTYLIILLESQQKRIKSDACYKQRFKEVLVNRRHGWHGADAQHSEQSNDWDYLIGTSRTYKWTAWELVH